VKWSRMVGSDDDDSFFQIFGGFSKKGHL